MNGRFGSVSGAMVATRIEFDNQVLGVPAPAGIQEEEKT